MSVSESLTPIYSPEQLACLSSDVEVRILRSLEELEALRPVWETWPGNRDSDIDFYQLVVRNNPESKRPHVLVVYRGGRPDAMLVGRLDSTRLDRVRIGYIRVRPRVDVLYFVYGALRGNPSRENSELLVQEICKSLAAGEADLAYLNFLIEGSPLLQIAKTAPPAPCQDRYQSSQVHFTRSLPSSVAEFRRGLSKRLLRFLRGNKLATDYPGAVKLRCFRDASELDELVSDAEAVARTSYQRGLGVGFKDTSEERIRLQLKAMKGWLRAYVLYIGAKPAAFWIGDINDGVFGSDYLAFDPVFSRYSPGMYLMLRAMEDLYSLTSRVTSIDFATGKAEYKEMLSDKSWIETSIFIFAPSIKGISLNILKSIATYSDHMLKVVLEKVGLLHRIKKAWRQRLGSRTAEGIE